MKIIVKDAQEAIEVAEVLKDAANRVEFWEEDYRVSEERIEDVRGYLRGMRDKIEIG